MEERFCNDCQEHLTPDNTKQHEGFDADGYAVAKPFNAMKEWFIKCDNCFDRAVDNYLANLYN